MPKTSLRIIVTGLIAQHPLLGGVTWDYLQYPLGLARLGHDVYYFEDSGEWPYNLDGGPTGKDWVAYDCSTNVRHLQKVMSRFGLQDKWAYRFALGGQWYGLSEAKQREILKSTDLVINVSGTLEQPERYREARTLVYIDSDPVFTQLKIANGPDEFSERVRAHDVFFTFGERLPEPLSTLGYKWQTTRQPIVRSEWPSSGAHRNVFTTVMSWTSYRPLEYAGQKYGQKDVEFRRFASLPQKVEPAMMEVALGKLFHASWQTDNDDLWVNGNISPRTIPEALTYLGWQVVDAMKTCGDMDRYREYIQSSKAEWSVAKNAYVVGNSGWFSCRSACYLAAGRPVIVQDTGFSGVLPTGEGIVVFNTLEEAVARIREIEGDYPRHAKAAREIAEAYFDSDKVLERLLDNAVNSRASLDERSTNV